MPHLKPVLLVEDNSNDIELVMHAFERNQLKNPLVVTRHGGEALDYLYRRGDFADRSGDDPIFILLDLKMPKVDGLEVLKQLKADEKLKLIPVVMLTASAEESDLVRSYGLGVNAYVVKPVDFNHFVNVIRDLSVFWAVINASSQTTASS